MEAAEPVIRAVLPDANVPESVREGPRSATDPPPTSACWWTGG
ncbi:hypothetical protein [Tessaracoccus coleopterorum]|nr:hypothetical protein [Tessaracoccus coleopterorum]